MAITIEGRESLQIPEGSHPARISALKVEKRGKEQLVNGLVGLFMSSKFEYLDVHVELEDVTAKDGKHPDINSVSSW
jgi:hypothetical protein